MAGKVIPYDTRCPVVDAFRRHKDADEAADMFGVSRREVYRLDETERETGDLHTHMDQRGRKPKLTPEQLAQIKTKLQETPDITINDLIDQLKLPISESRLSRIVRQQGFRLKKKVIHASEQERPRCAGEADKLH